MLRTSLYLPITLHQRLAIAARQEGKSFSKLVADLLDTALAHTEHTRVEHLYAELQQLDGIEPKGITDLSTTADAVLYGEQGVWRGQPHDRE